MLFQASSLALAQSGLNSPVAVSAYLNGVFPSSEPGTTTEQVTGYTQRNYFPEVSFVEPLRIVEHPVENSLLVVGKDGMGHLITNVEGATDKRLFFDIRPIMHGNPSFGEGGISDLAFHPAYGSGTQDVFISYWWSPVNSGTFSNDNGIDGYNRVSRFAVVNNMVDLASEEVLINQYDREYWHIGMDMQFGSDGFLYIAMGDETPTTCCDRADSTQSLDGGLWGGIIRIDVDKDPTRSHPIRRQPRHPSVDPTLKGSAWPQSYSQGYYIPNDNPFLATDGSVLEEFYSLGLRHSWTMSMDEANDDLWVADDLIRKGDNHQWPFREGTLSGPDPFPTTVFGLQRPPVWEYSRDVGTSVIGAGVYRGDRFPELVGDYLFSDFTQGNLWSASPDGSGYSVKQVGSVSAGWNNGISSYLFDSRGQILMARTGGALQPDGRIDVLERIVDGETSNNAPELLSTTGAFSDLSSMTAIEGCVSYELNVPFWSDGAEKYRWMCVPNDGSHNTLSEQIVFSENGPWIFPTGTVFIKHFQIESVDGDATTAFNLETRFTVIGEDSAYGLSYRWNEGDTDAFLVRASGETRAYVQQNNNVSEQRVWEYPSRNDCKACHDGPAGAALGLSTRQLNRFHTYQRSGLSANQLETLDFLNMFSENIDATQLSATAITSVPSDDTSASLELRARSYLDSNCGYCHQPGGVRSQFDARLVTPLEQQGIVDGALLEEYGIAGEAVIVPGRIGQSIAHLRLGSLDSLAMPPLSKSVVDTDGVLLLEQWIDSMAVVEALPPAVTGPSPNSVLTSETETFEWIANDITVAQWWLYVGSTKGGAQYYNSLDLGIATSTVVSTLPRDGSTVFVRLWFRQSGGAWEFIDTEYTALNDPSSTVAIVAPAADTMLNGSTPLLRWQGDDVESWWVYAGSSPGGAQYWNSGDLGLVSSIELQSLPMDGSQIYVRLWYKRAGRWLFVDRAYTASNNGPTLQPETGVVLGVSDTFSWIDNGAGISDWWLYVGSTVGGRDVLDSGLIPESQNELTVTGWQIGGPVYVRLWLETVDGNFLTETILRGSSTTLQRKVNTSFSVLIRLVLVIPLITLALGNY